MAKQLLFEGFMIRPIVSVVDLEAAEGEPSLIPAQGGEYRVALSGLDDWAKGDWPNILNALKAQLAEQEAEHAAAVSAAEAAQPRPVRRAAVRTAQKAAKSKKVVPIKSATAK